MKATRRRSPKLHLFDGLHVSVTLGLAVGILPQCAESAAGGGDGNAVDASSSTDGEAAPVDAGDASERAGAIPLSSAVLSAASVSGKPLFTVLSIFGFANDNVVAVGVGGFAAHYEGSAWTATPTPTIGASLSAVWGSSPLDLWAVGAEDVILRSTAPGDHVTAQILINPYHYSFFYYNVALTWVWGASKDVVWIV